MAKHVIRGPAITWARFCVTAVTVCLLHTRASLSTLSSPTTVTASHRVPASTHSGILGLEDTLFSILACACFRA
jgi:hypothetical protein